jgi:hypothetical protein
MVFHAALSVRESARPLNESRKAHKGFQNFLLGFDSDSGTSRTLLLIGAVFAKRSVLRAEARFDQANL